MVFEYFPSWAYAPLVATFIWCLAIGLIAYFAVFRIAYFDVLGKSPLAGPMIGTPTIMFTFVMAFMGSAAWQNIAQAHAARADEHAALVRMAAIPLQPEAVRRQSQATMKQYLDAVIDQEWAKNFNQHPAPSAETALDRLEAGIWAADTRCQGEAKPSASCSSPLQIASYLKALDDLRTARDRRLSLGAQGTLPLKWLFAMSLALMSAFVIAAVHRTNPRTATISVVLFCTSAWFIFSLVALHIQPYRGPDAVSPGSLAALRASL